jgi:hypothetical protein
MLVDLRGTAAEAAGERFFEVLHSAPTAGTDAQRALVVDDTDRLEEHHPVFEAIFRSREVDRVICVAVGEPLDRAAGYALRATPVLAGEQAAILWVGDPEGVAWRMESGTAVRPAASVPGDGGPPLQRLLEALLAPEVFDRVVVDAGRIPAGVASPGLRTAAGQIDPETLLAAQRRAVAVVAGGPVDDVTAEHAGPSLEGCELLLGRADRLPRGYSPLRADSELGRLSRHCEDACRDAARQVDQMLGLAGLLAPGRPGRRIHGQLVLAGRAVEQYRDRIADLFDYGDPGGSLDSGRRAELQRQGVNWTPVPAPSQADVFRSLAGAVDRAIGRQPLRTLAGWLRIVSERAVPQGSASYLARLDGLGGPWIAGRLTGPSPFPLPMAPPGVLLAAAGCTLLAGIGGPAAGVTVAVVWLVLFALAAGRQPTSAGEAGARTLIRPALAWHALSVALGASLGAVVAGVVRVPWPLAAVVATAGVAGLLVTLSRWWSGAVRRWRADLALTGAIALAGRQDALLREVAALEWVLADRRHLLADAARAVAGALSTVADAMDGYLESASPSLGAAHPGVVPERDTMDELQAVVDADVGDAVREVLRPCWQLIRAGTPDQVRAGLANDIRGLLDEYGRHLERHNIHERPRFAARRDGALPAVDQLWGPPGRLAEVVAASRDGLLVQLCAAPDLALLHPTGKWTRTIRFAPRSAHEAVVEGAFIADVDEDLDDLVWTSVGHLAGVVRLVPLRPGAVELTWPKEGGDEYPRG